MIERTPEQVEDHRSVWEQMRAKYPEFTRAHDSLDNYHGVREIVLGGSTSWGGAHKRFQPFPGARVLDLGANAGLYTAFCALRGAFVTAYEPDPVTFAVLSDLVRDTKLERVALKNAAVWTHTGTMSFRGFGSFTCGRMERNGEALGYGQEKAESEYGQSVPCISFNDAIGGVDWDCVKIDIEGAEYETLLSASSQVLSRVKFAYLELHPWVSQDLYDRTVDKLSLFFDLDGGKADVGNRWQYLYLMRKS